MSSGFGTRLVDLSYVQEDAPVDGLRAYLRRIQGVDTTPEPCPAFPPLAILPANRTASNYTAEALAAKAKTLCWSFVACFTGIAILAYIHYNLHATYASGVKVLSITGSFGAMAILVFGAIHAPLAQPRNCIVGNTLSAFVGVAIADLFHHVAPGDEWKWLSCALAISISLVAMQLTDTVNPPGGASALLAVTSGREIQDLGYLYVVIPVFTGSCILVLVSVLVTNVQRQYPRYWFSK
ncbi:hypothetical protein H310_04514 [Aphanomyces invadans]|uniref:HPP transmembrane region domain-containing protein n=1 Tax=Aphanomyces invadans TaxID=157072 RepID=A0A024UCL2_9STRA|nr:hypothetical protein H310_04514 [Aphanomyces invadans]ETW04161.1 hypothetical protein H310_04514 [Aphanomyces invadans]|eukprot:XP_008867117.1 hypothetical protein H310_04514 [Aphanomyces invadans]